VHQEPEQLLGGHAGDEVAQLGGRSWGAWSA
jgi:hypothetical protein